MKVTIESDAGKFSTELEEDSTWGDVIVQTLHLLNTSYLINLSDIDSIQHLIDGMYQEKRRKLLEGRGYELD